MSNAADRNAQKSMSLSAALIDGVWPLVSVSVTSPPSPTVLQSCPASALLKRPFGVLSETTIATYVNQCTLH